MSKQRQAENEETRSAQGGEWRVLAALIVLTIAAVGGLYAVARNATSSGVDNPDSPPVPTVSSAEGCANFAHYWMDESGANLDATVIEGLTNCWVSDAGEWFVPNSDRDERLPEGVALSDEERSATDPLRQELLLQIENLESTLSSSIQKDLQGIYDPRVRPVTGHIKDGVGISRQRNRYTRVTQAFLLAPENAALAGYVGWLMEQKIGAFETLSSTCASNPDLAYLRTVCAGIEDSLSVRYPPFTWDLRNSVSLETYLAHLIRTNSMPDAGQNIAEAPATAEAIELRSGWLWIVG